MKKISFALFALLQQILFANFEPFHSQCGQDQYIYQHFFQDKKNGIFVDIGAHDGLFYSNTYFFENCLGWKGLCVEPIPEVFEKLQKSRKAICIKGCISSEYNEASFMRILGDPPALEMLSGIIEKYDPRHIERIQRQIKNLGGSYEIITVQCYDLTKLLIENGLQHIDYLSLDTEGGELEILKSIDFNQITIDVISVENNYAISGFKDLLEPLGYQKVAQLEQDEIYKLLKIEHKTQAIEKICNDPKKTHNPSYPLSRVLRTIQGEDADSIPKVPLAGQIVTEGDLTYQIMHNGVKVVKDGYYGENSWMSDIIYGLKGHHEPQEEKLFYEVLKSIPPQATMVELGSYWAYYSLWFAQAIPGAVNYLVEPDLWRLMIGKTNFDLNQRVGSFFQAYVGPKGNDGADFSGAEQIEIDTFLQREKIDHVHILHCDIQGAEFEMLRTCKNSMGKIDYFFISTHSDQLHSDCLTFLTNWGFLILAEHTPKESCSEDGLIAAKRRDVPGPTSISIRKY